MNEFDINNRNILMRKVNNQYKYILSCNSNDNIAQNKKEIYNYILINEKRIYNLNYLINLKINTNIEFKINYEELKIIIEKKKYKSKYKLFLNILFKNIQF